MSKKFFIIASVVLLLGCLGVLLFHEYLDPTLIYQVKTNTPLLAQFEESLEEAASHPEKLFGAELGSILKECGFALVDDKSKERADVEITGEAFSAYGLRKGNLISCKARIELKAQRHGGDILAVDRQTSVAVDIAEQTAAKTALQNAWRSWLNEFYPSC